MFDIRYLNFSSQGFFLPIYSKTFFRTAEKVKLYLPLFNRTAELYVTKHNTIFTTNQKSTRLLVDLNPLMLS